MTNSEAPVAKQKRHHGRATKGSQLHLQNLVNESPELLNGLLFSASPKLRAFATEEPRWVSPLADDYREYQDKRFLEVLGLGSLSDRLKAFWPRGGPVWDGLATVPGAHATGVILLEAKSHEREAMSDSYGCRAKGNGRRTIETSLTAVRGALGVRADADWLGPLYQPANRLAHLHFLRANGVETWLVFLYFTGDADQQGPISATGWTGTLSRIEEGLGLHRRHALTDRVLNLFGPVSSTPGPASA